MVSVILYTCIFMVALLMDLFVLCVACLTVFINCFVKQFSICLGVVVILLLSVGVGVGALLDGLISLCVCPVSYVSVCKLSFQIALDLLTILIRSGVTPLDDTLITEAFPVIIHHIMNSDDTSTLQVL